MIIGTKTRRETPPWLARLATPRWGIVACLVVVTLGVYAPVLQNGFVDYDDPGYVTENSIVKQGLTLSGILWAFKSSFLANWHPVTWLAHMVDCSLFGLDPMGHHVVSVLWHAANGVLVFVLLSRMTGTLWRSALVAALFAWHPLRVESVAWISERKDVLSTFFGLLAIWYYHRYVTRASRSAYLLSLAVFAVSLMAKPMLVTMPFVLLLLDYWPLNRLTLPWLASTAKSAAPADPGASERVSLRDAIVEKLPYLALTVACSGVALWTQGSAKAISSLQVLSVGERLVNVGLSYAAYLTQFAWPDALRIPYLYGHNQSTAEALRAFLVLLGLSAGCLIFRGQRWLTTGWCFYLGTLVPVIGFIHVGEQAHADRYTYFPQIGIAIALVWGAAELVLRRPRLQPAVVTLWVVVLVACLPLTWRQVGFWKSTETLFSRTVAKDPNNRVALANLSTYYLQTGDLVRAGDRLKEFNRVAPPGKATALFVADALYQLNRPEDGMKILESYARSGPVTGEVRLSLGRFAEALGDRSRAYAEYEKAMEFKETRTVAMLNLGVVQTEDRKLAAAAESFNRALAAEPGNLFATLGLAAVKSDMGELPEAHLLLRRAMAVPAFTSDEFYRFGAVQAKLGMLAEAEANYLHSIARNQLNFEAHYNLGNLYARDGSFTNAARFLSRAVQLRPGSVESRNNLGITLASLGLWEEASRQYREVIKLAPASPDAYFGLARVQELTTNWVGAATNFSLALQRKPDLQEARIGLGIVLIQQAKWSEAVRHLELFLSSNPASGLGHRQLATALMKLKRLGDAVPHWERAIELRPQDRVAVEALARLLATAAEPAIRNGARAVALAERLVIAPNLASARELDTLAAAYAEMAAFDKARTTGTQALQRAQAAGDAALAAEVGRHLELYAHHKPLRD